jgi:hypothetical protein
MATRMQQRRGTAAQWDSADPILEAGEIGFESDTNKFKMGDGVNQWSDLDYFINESAISTDIEGAISDSEKGANNGVATLDSTGKVPLEQLGNLIDGAPSALNTLNEIAAALNDDEDFANATIGHLADVDDLLAVHANSLTNLETSIATLSNSVSSLDDVVEGQGNNITSIQSSLSTIESDISNTQSDLSTHESITANVHGIANTADLATQSYVNDAKANAIANASAYADGLAGNYEATGAVSTHSSDTTNVHGITDTSVLVTTAGGTISGSLTITGDLIVSGNTLTVGTQDLVVTDPMIYLGEDNEADSLDLGIVASHTVANTYSHTGIVRDASTGKWKFFNGVTDEPTTVINFSQGTLDDVELKDLTAASATIGGVAFTAKANATATIADMNGSHTVVSSDVNNVREMSGGGTLSIPSDNAFWPVGQRMEVIQTGSSEVTIAGSSGVTVNGTPGLKLRGQWSGAVIIKRASNTFVVIGDLKA